MAAEPPASGSGAAAREACVSPAARELFVEACAQLGILPPPGALTLCARYLELLAAANQRHNLTGVRDPDEAWNVIVIQSLLFLPPLLEADVARQRRVARRAVAQAESAGAPADAQLPFALVDVGSGAGVPALTLAACWPLPGAVRVAAIEATKKKADFIASAALELGLTWVEVHAERAEEIARNPQLREGFDAAVGRAVGPLPEVLEYTLPLVRPGGIVLVAKGFDQIDEELPAGRVAARLLGGAEPEVQLVHLAGRRTALVSVQKHGRTAALYPRRPGVPRKEPLGHAPR